MEEIASSEQQEQLAEEGVLTEDIEPQVETEAAVEPQAALNVPEHRGGGYIRLAGAMVMLAVVVGLHKDEKLTPEQIAENLRLAKELYDRQEAEKQAEIEEAIRKDARLKSARREGERGNN